MTDLLLFSSGDLRADRRLSLAQALHAEGDRTGALDLVGQALELAPRWPAAWFLQGELCQETGDHAGAVAAFRQCLGLDPSDALGSLLRLTLLGAALTPDKAPEAYVRTLFDQYAPRFDQALLTRLAYRGHDHLQAAVQRVCRDRAAGGDVPSLQGPRFARTLDLGCGTGLTGTAFRLQTAWLEGVDLSPGMIREARRKKLYDALHQGEITAFLPTITRPFDLIVAGDVLIYLGDLAPLFGAIARILAPGGLFAFTVQAAPEPGPEVRLGPDQRFAHGAGYLRRLAQGCGLTLLSLEAVSCRCEAGQPVPSLVAVCGRAGDDLSLIHI